VRIDARGMSAGSDSRGVAIECSRTDARDMSAGSDSRGVAIE
jgi:hypothetical protein